MRQNKKNDSTSELIIKELTDRNSGLEFTKEYLKSGFVSDAIDQLFQARRQSGLTQTYVAEQMNTRQNAIARLEADTDGSISFRRYTDFALSCGMVPLNIVLVPIELARDFVVDNPNLPLNPKNYDFWLVARETASSTEFYNQPVVPDSPVMKTVVKRESEYDDPQRYSSLNKESNNTNKYGGRLAA